MGLGWHDVAQKLPKRIDFFEPDELDSRPFKFLPSALNFEGKLAAGATRLGVVALDKKTRFFSPEVGLSRWLGLHHCHLCSAECRRTSC